MKKIMIITVLGVLSSLALAVTYKELTVTATMPPLPTPDIVVTGSWSGVTGTLGNAVSGSGTAVMEISNGCSRNLTVSVAASGTWAGMSTLNLTSNDGGTPQNSTLSLTTGSVTGYTGNVTDIKTVNWQFAFPSNSTPSSAGDFNGILTFTIVAQS